MRFISHNDAIRLEFIVRGVYQCERSGVMGIANADHLESNPMDAAIVVFAPLYKEYISDLSEIDNFMDKFSSIFNYPEDYEYDESVVKEYISGLEELISKYITEE